MTLEYKNLNIQMKNFEKTQIGDFFYLLSINRTRLAVRYHFYAFSLEIPSPSQFIIRLLKKEAGIFTFYSSNLKLNKVVLDLSMGNHDLFLRRRKPDTIEIQQMKTQAKEERTRRHHERQKLLKEKQLREDLQREKHELQRQLLEMRDQVRNANEDMVRADFRQQNHSFERFSRYEFWLKIPLR